MNTYRLLCNCEQQKWVGSVEWKSDGTLMVNVDCGGIHRWPGCYSEAERENARRFILREYLKDLLAP